MRSAGSPMSSAASQAASMESRSGGKSRNWRTRPQNFRQRIRASATELREEVSAAMLFTCSMGLWLTSRMERTADLAAMAASGRITSPGMVA